MERQRWRESMRETSAVQLSLFTLNPSRTHSHCHTHPPKGASNPGPGEEGECISVTCMAGWRRKVQSHTHTCMCSALLKHTFLILQALRGCLPSFNLSVPSSFFLLPCFIQQMVVLALLGEAPVGKASEMPVQSTEEGKGLLLKSHTNAVNQVKRAYCSLKVYTSRSLVSRARRFQLSATLTPSCSAQFPQHMRV